MGFKRRPSAKYAGVWIRIPPTDRAYGPIAAAVTLKSALAQLRPSGRLSIVPKTTVAGQRVIGGRGSTTTPRGGAPMIL
jgi:hypothetical protein